GPSPPPFRLIAASNVRQPEPQRIPAQHVRFSRPVHDGRGGGGRRPGIAEQPECAVRGAAHARPHRAGGGAEAARSRRGTGAAALEPLNNLSAPAKALHTLDHRAPEEQPRPPARGGAPAPPDPSPRAAEAPHHGGDGASAPAPPPTAPPPTAPPPTAPSSVLG